MTTWLEDKLGDVSGNALGDPAAPTTPTRLIGTAFQPSATKDVWCSYTINIANTSGQTTTVDLLSDSANPPTTGRCSAKQIAGSTDGQTCRQQLTYLCPAGHYIKLVASGSGTPTISDQVERAFT